MDKEKEEKREIMTAGSETPPITSMSALSEASTPAQDGAPPSIDTQQLQQHNQQLASDLGQQPQQPGSGASSAPPADGGRKRACVPSLPRPCPAVARPDLLRFSQGALRSKSLHRLPRRQDKVQRGPPMSGPSSTPHSPPPDRCLVLIRLPPHQSCLKRGMGASCAYPDPDADNHQPQTQPRTSLTLLYPAVVHTS